MICRKKEYKVSKAGNESMASPIIIRTAIGALIPGHLPPDALFLLNLGPYPNDESLLKHDYGREELRRAAMIRVLVERLEEVADTFEDIGYSILETNEPSPTDYPADEYELRVDGWTSEIRGVIRDGNSRLATLIDSIEAAVATQSE
jgi:hypothetical protein